MIEQELKSGALIELLPSLRPKPMPIWAVMPSSRLVPPRVRVLLDSLAESAAAFPDAPRPRAVNRRGVPLRGGSGA